jgi:hypothetical protein
VKAGTAWYVQSRSDFIRELTQLVVQQLSDGAAREGLHVEHEQRQEWEASIGVLQRELQQRALEIQALKDALADPDLGAYRHVILEYDLRRRGLRIDCVLLGDGVIAVVEFKRSRFSAADREQVTNYAVNLMEFHEETRRAVEQDGAIVVPVLSQTGRRDEDRLVATPGFHRTPWTGVVRRPIESSSSKLHEALKFALTQRRSEVSIDCTQWLYSRFSPSSSILDAAISLYGQHTVSAIAEHSAPIELIERCTREVLDLTTSSLRDGVNRVIFVSGSPGAGKTLVGLNLAFQPALRNDAVFVTGNAPLVEVLSAALKSSYRKGTAAGVVASGYAREDAERVIGMSTFKLVKAHHFLGQRGKHLGGSDGRVIIFDEAQRTYREGHIVVNVQLEEDEANLILRSLAASHPNGSVVIALVGHNQAIGRAEMGIGAWFKACAELGWRFAICDETLSLEEVEKSGKWAAHPYRDRLTTGHLPHSIRYYRNEGLERWANHVLGNRPEAAAVLADELAAKGDTIWITRSLSDARRWVRERRVGAERAGVIASGQARRLAAEGLFVELKPDIATWMLAPDGDVRSGNMLETVQNQYQIQGLELDYTIVCWDGDLRREGDQWEAHKIVGAGWRRDKELAVSKNGYRVLLTRARKGLVIFVPVGDIAGEDETRLARMYDEVSSYLVSCGARKLSAHQM